MIKKEEIIPLLPTYLLNSKIYSLVITDLEGNYVFVNEVFEKNFSFISEDLIGLPFIATVHPEDVEKCNQAAYACMMNPDLTLEVDIRKPKQDNKDYYWTSWEFSLFKNKQNQAIGIIAIGYDITPQKALEKDKQLLSERFEKIVENIPGFIYQYCIRADGTSFFPYASPGIEQLLGVPSKNLRTSDEETLSLVHPDDLEELMASAQRSVQALKPWKHEWRSFLNGKIRWLGGSSTPQKMEDGSVVFYGYIQDITDKKLAEQALIQSKNTLRETIDNAPGAFYQYILYADGSDRIFNINHGLYEIWEISREDIKQKPNVLWDAIHPNDLEITRKSVKESAQTLKPWDWQFRIIPPSGKVKWLYGRGTPHLLPGGAVMWYVFVTDVTARNQAQQELEKMQALLSETGRIAKIGGWELDIDTDVITWTPEVYRIYGLDQHYIPNPIQDLNFYLPEDIELLQQGFNQAIQTRESVDIELRVRNVLDQLIWVNIKGKPIYQDDKLIKLIGTIQDITERKQAEQKIRDSEIKLKAIYDSTGDHNFFISPDYKILFFNKRVKDFIQEVYQKEIREGDSILDYVLDEVKPSFLDSFEKALQEKIVHTEMEINFGSFTEWFQASFFPVYDQDNKFIGVANNLSNITERKKAEKLLEQALDNYTSLINTIDGIVWEADAQTFNFTFVSKQAEKMLGYPIHNWFEPNFWVSKILEEDQERTLKFCITQTQNGKAHDFEYRMLSAQGEVVWMRDIVSVMTENGTPTKLRGLMIDITHQKKAEQLLLKSKEQFKNIIEVSPIPKLLIDAKHQIVFCSLAFTQTFGYTLEDIPNLDAWQSQAHPDPEYRQYIKNIWNKQWEALVKKAQPFENIELNIRCKDGSDRVVMAGVVWLEGDPEQFNLITLYDITKIKKYEQKILSQNKTLKIIAWMQSHQVRKPLSTMMGLIKLIQDVKPSDKEVYLTYLYETAKELDEIIHEIVHKTEKLDDQDQDDIPID